MMITTHRSLEMSFNASLIDLNPSVRERPSSAPPSSDSGTTVSLSPKARRSPIPETNRKTAKYTARMPGARAPSGLLGGLPGPSWWYAS